MNFLRNAEPCHGSVCPMKWRHTNTLNVIIISWNTRMRHVRVRVAGKLCVCVMHINGGTKIKSKFQVQCDRHEHVMMCYDATNGTHLRLLSSADTWCTVRTHTHAPVHTFQFIWNNRDETANREPRKSLLFGEQTMLNYHEPCIRVTRSCASARPCMDASVSSTAQLLQTHGCTELRILWLKIFGLISLM